MLNNISWPCVRKELGRQAKDGLEVLVLVVTIAVMVFGVMFLIRYLPRDVKAWGALTLFGTAIMVAVLKLRDGIREWWSDLTYKCWKSTVRK